MPSEGENHNSGDDSFSRVTSFTYHHLLFLFFFFFKFFLSEISFAIIIPVLLTSKVTPRGAGYVLEKAQLQKGQDLPLMLPRSGMGGIGSALGQVEKQSICCPWPVLLQSRPREQS